MIGPSAASDTRPSQPSPASLHILKPHITMGKWVNGLKLQHKIAWSFGLSISVAIVGMATGWSIAEFSLSRARTEIADSQAEQKMLHEIETSLLKMHLHQKGTILTLSNLPQWKKVYATFLDDRASFNTIWNTYKNDQELVQGDTIYDRKERQLIAELKTSYARFSKDLDSLTQQLQTVDLEQLSEDDRRALQVKLTTLNNEALRRDAYEFLRLIQELTENSEIQLQEAQTLFRRAEFFRLQIIIASALISLLITIFLISILSQTISASIEEAARTATEVIETSNFDLQVPVKGTDEVSKLSAALNRLIFKVKQLLKEEQGKSKSLEDALSEIRATQSVLVQSEKMSALGEMVAGVAHEINNPVGFIHGNLTPLQEHLQDLTHALQLYQQHDKLLPPETLEELQHLELDYLLEDSGKILTSMKDGTQRIREIVLSLRNFSRLDESEIKHVDIHEGIDSTLTILSHRLKANGQNQGIEVIKKYATLPKIECYAGQLNQVFMNILSNAIDALEECKRAPADIKKIAEEKITTEDRQGISNQIYIQTEATDDEQVKIRIRDNGSGIPEHLMDKLFDPFFTTKAVGKGTGLGLSISYKIVTNKHKGTLQCHSRLGEGTEFIIQIPIHSNQHPLLQ